MDELGNHHSQKSDTRTENQPPHVLAHRQVLKNKNLRTQGGEYHTLGSVGWNRGRTVGSGELGRDSMGRMPDIGEGEEGSKSHCHMCTYATILHVLHMYPKT